MVARIVSCAAMSFETAFLDKDEAQAESGARPSDIWVGTFKHIADGIRHKFWRGEVFLATKEQMAGGTWWTTRKIGLALSACVGPFGNIGTDKKYWFN